MQKKEEERYLLCFRLGFSVFLNNGDASEMGYDSNDYLPEACQINLDYAGEYTIKYNNVIVIKS